MPPIFEIHVHNHVDLEGVITKLNSILKKLDTMALTLAQFKAALAEVSTEQPPLCIYSQSIYLRYAERGQKVIFISKGQA